MMKRITILLAFISLNAYGQKANWKTYTHDNYSIQYPPEWDLEENRAGIIFALISPIDTANPTFNKNINFLTPDLKGQGMDLDRFNEISVTQIKNYFPNDSIITEEKGKDATGEYRHLIYVGDENGQHLEFEQYYRVINDTAYILTLTMLKTQWGGGHQIGDQILSTFKIK